MCFLNHVIKKWAQKPDIASFKDKWPVYLCKALHLIKCSAITTLKIRNNFWTKLPGKSYSQPWASSLEKIRQLSYSLTLVTKKISHLSSNINTNFSWYDQNCMCDSKSKTDFIKVCTYSDIFPTQHDAKERTINQKPGFYKYW